MPPKNPESSSGSKPPEQAMTPTAASLQADLVAMVEAQKATSSPVGGAAETSATPVMGRAEAKGAAIGRKIDNLAERGSDAVAAGKEKLGNAADTVAEKAYDAAGAIDRGVKSVKERAKGVRERVEKGADLATEKRKEAVAAAKEKSQKAMLVAIGVSIAGAEAIANIPENAKKRGKKIGETLNRWASKAMEAISGRAQKTKESIAGGISAAAEKIGDVIEAGVDKVDTKLSNWEARLQQARQEAEAAAEQARLESLRKSYIEARVENTTKEANAEYDEAISRAEKTRQEKIAKAETGAAQEVQGLTAEQLEDAIKQLLAAPEPQPVEKPAESAPGTSEVETAPDVMPAAA